MTRLSEELKLEMGSNSEYLRMRGNTEYDQYSDDTLMEVVYRELKSKEEGEERYYRMEEKNIKKGNELANTYGNMLRGDKLDIVATNLKAKIDAQKEKGAGRRAVGLAMLEDFDPRLVSAYSLEIVLTSLTRERTVTAVALAIASRIEDGIVAQMLAKDAPRLWNKARESMLHQNQHQQGSTLNALVLAMEEGRYGEKYQKIAERFTLRSRTDAVHGTTGLWPQEVKVQIGLLMLDLIIKSTGIVTIMSGEMKQPDKVVPTPAILEWIGTISQRRALMAPSWLPLPIPPKDWSTPWDGGYHTVYVPKYPLIGKTSKNFIEEVEANGDLSFVYKAVNAAQHTAWRINRRLYDVATTMWDNRFDVACLPGSTEANEPVCPACGRRITPEERKDKTHPCFKAKEVLKTWKDGVRRAHINAAINISKAIEVSYTLELARRVLDDDVIYFPYFLDFRGRLYCRVPYLSPQGSGLGKSMLEFAEGKRLGSQEAADWLAIHVANSFGHDKLPFEERIQWVKDNTAMICAVAENPIDNRECWATMPQADAWPALAASFEWAGYCANGVDHVSHIPVAQDGTCSGLQHYAALLRDEHTAKQVNVAPSDRPSDVYKSVAERTKVILEGMVGDPENGDLAVAWLSTGLITRKLTKRSVMTLPYGSTYYSCSEYVLEHYLEAVSQGAEAGPWSEYKEQVKACHWLGGVVWKAIKDVLTVAPVAMGILQKAARIMAKQGLPLNWRAPSGFQVQQANICYKARRVRYALCGTVTFATVEGRHNPVKNDHLPKELRVTLREPTDLIDEPRQASGVAPNFVHSLDASAMVLTVCKMKDAGFNSFSLIHDSFAVHAADSAALARTLREAFVEMYTNHDPLNDLFAEFIRMLEAIGADKDAINKLVALQKQLPYSDFDLSRVMESKYFFA